MLAWTLLLSPSQAQQAAAPISPQSKASGQTTHRQSSTHHLQATTNCYARQASTYPSGNPAHSIQSPTTQRKHSIRTAVWQDLRSHHLDGTPPPPSSINLHESKLTASAGHRYQAVPPQRPVIIEAQGWTRDKQGRIFLTSSFSRMRRHGTTQSNREC